MDLRASLDVLEKENSSLLFKLISVYKFNLLNPPDFL